MLPDWFVQLGLMGWPLLACSIIALMICFERCVFLYNLRTDKNTHFDKLRNQLEQHKDHPKQTRDELSALMLLELQGRYYSGIKGLRIIGMISPMIGLLGTVFGIISAFKIIAVQTGPIAPNMIAQGLWEALLTTAFGLIIALPCLIAAHFFRHISETILSDYCLRLNRLSLSYEIDQPLQKAKSQRRAA